MTEKQHTLLIVDDEPLNQIILEEEFDKQFKLELADNGMECLAMIAKNCPDLLLLDGKMPNMNGIEVCLAIRAMEGKVKNLPIIMLSANASKVEKEQGISAGANFYLSKPFDMDELNTLIKSCL